MSKYLVNKLLQLTIVMVLISFFSFAVIYFAPGDISYMYISQEMSEQQKEQIREELGVNQGLSDQYLNWASKVVRGDFGMSLSQKTKVSTLLMDRLPATLYLMGTSLVVTLLLAIPLGLFAGYHQGDKVDRIISLCTYTGMSLPSFWFGMMLIILFSAKLKILPSSGIQTVGIDSSIDRLRHLFMPCMALSVGNIAIYIRYIRTSTIQQLNQEYVLAAIARGTNGWKLLRRHILKNTLLPIITLLGMNLTSLVTGSFIIETIFGWPGVGTLAMSAIGVRDYPVIMAYIMLSGLLLVLGNFIAEILYAVIDPRIKQKGVS